MEKGKKSRADIKYCVFSHFKIKCRIYQYRNTLGVSQGNDMHFENISMQILNVSTFFFCFVVATENKTYGEMVKLLHFSLKQVVFWDCSFCA